jgi:hypothetical protein
MQSNDVSTAKNLRRMIGSAETRLRPLAVLTWGARQLKLYLPRADA